MNPYVKSGIKCVVLTLWSASLSVGTILTYEQLHPRLVQTDLDAFEQKLNTALLDQATEQAASLDALSKKLHILDEGLLTLESDLAELLQRQQSQESVLSEFENKISNDVDTKLNKLESKLTTKLNNQQSLRSRSVIPAKPTSIQKSKPKAIVRAPFELYDVQKRGTAYLAIVGKPGATRLSQLSAVQEGQSYRAWRLVLVEPGRVSLEKGSHRIELEVRS
uniref:Uncharacterized protein n=1 Tax=Aliivibrio fischeri TaxID=668 RepID=H2ES29_ALIFS|nr:hypothetical protein [Aliivibrio fischeri]AEY78196.1 hypothetical protein [Aliivibrio fischeri]